MLPVPLPLLLLPPDLGYAGGGEWFSSCRHRRSSSWCRRICSGSRPTPRSMAAACANALMQAGRFELVRQRGARVVQILRARPFFGSYLGSHLTVVFGFERRARRVGGQVRASNHANRVSGAGHAGRADDASHARVPAGKGRAQQGAPLAPRRQALLQVAERGRGHT